MGVKSWGIPRRAQLHGGVVVVVDPTVWAGAIEMKDHGIALGDGPPFDRLERAGPIAQALQHVADGVVSNLDGWTLQRDRGKIAWIERRDRLDRGGERHRSAFLERHVLDVGRVDRLDASFPQRFVDGAGNEVVHHVMEDLLPETLLNQVCGALPGRKPGSRACLV